MTFTLHISKGEIHLSGLSLYSHCNQVSSYQGCYFFSQVVFKYQSILLQDLDKTSQLKYICNHFEIKILLF